LTEPKDRPALEDLRADAKRVSEYCYKAFAPPADEADRVAQRLALQVSAESAQTGAQLVRQKSPGGSRLACEGKLLGAIRRAS
jgi:hypothetical protein